LQGIDKIYGVGYNNNKAAKTIAQKFAQGMCIYKHIYLFAIYESDCLKEMGVVL
jgi:hypothetical protein